MVESHFCRHLEEAAKNGEIVGEDRTKMERMLEVVEAVFGLNYLERIW